MREKRERVCVCVCVCVCVVSGGCSRQHREREPLAGQISLKEMVWLPRSSGGRGVNLVDLAAGDPPAELSLPELPKVESFRTEQNRILFKSVPDSSMSAKLKNCSELVQSCNTSLSRQCSNDRCRLWHTTETKRTFLPTKLMMSLHGVCTHLWTGVTGEVETYCPCRTVTT